ncbi:MAG: NUDIX hydrolase [Niameybacter sp.]
MNQWMEAIKAYIPYNEQEEKDKALIVGCMETYNNLLTRENPVAHFSSSGFIVNKTRDKVLMIHHNIYNAWSWTGGHTDGETDFLGVAIREAQEEAGVKVVTPISKEIFSLDVLPVNGHVKKGVYVSAHLHLSMAYLVEVDEQEELTIKPDENSGVRWIPVNELDMYIDNEPDMLLLYKKFMNKIGSSPKCVLDSR